MKAKVTISRGSDGMVRIRFRDDTSGIEFAEVAMTPENFGYAITNLAEREGELEIRGLEWVGKQRVTERRQIECPLNSYDREKLSEWLNTYAQEEGWLLDSYLGSQSSVNWKGGKTILNYSVTKYI
jgi:hypothetical protein